MTNTSAMSYESALQAHKILMDTVAELEHLVKASREEQSGVVAERLKTLRTELSAHFAAEEEGGYMAIVLKRAVHKYREVEMLLGQHHQLLQTLDGLTDGVQASGEPRQLDSLSREKILKWVAALRGHESHENRLVLEVFTCDICAED
ncbi:MAG: hemerythrin domain-containing protein [Planctomycetes bacterium]|nr:hemerythrin domain-containing protein [Planctomycetota bacterium]